MSVCLALPHECWCEQFSHHKLKWAETFQRLQHSACKHAPRLLLNKDGAGRDLSDANWVSTLNTRILHLWHFMLKWDFYTDLYRFDKEKWIRDPLCTELKYVNIVCSLAVLFFIMWVRLLRKQQCLTFRSSLLLWSTWTQRTGTKAPRCPSLTWFSSNWKVISLFEWILVNFFSIFVCN